MGWQPRHFGAKFWRPQCASSTVPRQNATRNAAAKISRQKVSAASPLTKPSCLRKFDFRLVLFQRLRQKEKLSSKISETVDKDTFCQWCFAPSTFVRTPKARVVNETRLKCPGDYEEYLFLCSNVYGYIILLCQHTQPSIGHVPVYVANLQ